MNIYADLHIHSKYARATSKNLNIANLEKYARIKGLGLLGTADFTHPKWKEELKQSLPEEKEGVYYTKTGFPFIYSTEISLIYTQDGKGRRIHVIVLAPSRETAEQITETLGKRGRLDYDGRPIFKITGIEFVEIMKKINPNIEVIPAHIWTPWFGVFGSMSGFDSLKQAFGEYEKDIHAIETGLSSDPEMNWRIKELDNKAILSFSDAHSFWPWKLGRECTQFSLKELTYTNLLKAIRENQIISTIEFFPEEGKYHWDGHRNCRISMKPAESVKHKNICPVCRKQLTLGVEHRVEALADRMPGERKGKPYNKIIPLSELIAASINSSPNTKKTTALYNEMIKTFGNEMKIMLETTEQELAKQCNEKLLNYIKKNRSQQINWQPGYDGVYGRPLLEGFKEHKEPAKPIKKDNQTSLS